MAHWFHRNPIKATKEVTFELKSVLVSSESQKICAELRLRRPKLLELFKNASNDLAEVEDQFKQYLGLFAGFLQAIGRNPGEVLPEISKLSPLIRFRWTSSMLGSLASEVSESWFEALSICVNMALWLTKHAAWTAAKDEVHDQEAKRVHSCLRRAAGIFLFVLSNVDKVSGVSSIAGSDYDPAVLTAYVTMCTAEAQEVTVARAIELKHSPGLISALAKETSTLFDKADKSISKLDETIFGKWRRYLQMKTQIYLAYAYAFMGEKLLAEDKCGEAIRTCKEGISCFEIAKDFAAKYTKTNGPGMSANPESHLFFRRIEPMLRRHLEKAERENGLIYHQKVPDEFSQLEEKATYGLVEPETFTLPPPSQLWNFSVYVSFDLSKATMPDFSKIKVSKKELPPVKEEKLYETDRDPNNQSGCVIS